MRNKKALIIVLCIILITIIISISAIILNKDITYKDTNTININFDDTNVLNTNSSYNFNIISSYKTKYNIEIETNLDDLNIILKNKDGSILIDKDIEFLSINPETNNYILYTDYIIETNQIDYYTIVLESKYNDSIKVYLETIS